MFCGKCGNEIKPGERFCGQCGAPVETQEEEKQAVEEVSQATTEPVTEPEDNVEETSQAITEPSAKPEVKAEENVETVGNTAEEANAEKKKPKTKEKKRANHSVNNFTILIVALVGIAAVALVAVLVAFVIVPLFTDETNQMVYVKDETLYYLKDMSKPDKAIEVEDLENMSYLEGAQFSEDGKYLYFYSELDTDDYTYTLNRIKLSKLKENGNHYKYIEEISTDVFSYVLSDKGTVYYIDEHNTLIQYDDGKERDLIKDVWSYKINEKNKRIYYCVADDDEEMELGYVETKTGKEVEIDSDVYDVYDFNKDGTFIYTKVNDDGDKDIYVATSSNEPVCVAEDINTILDVDLKTGTVYYDYAKEEEKVLYDFVNDTAAAEDAGVKEPEYKDALVPITEDEAFQAVMTDYMREEYLTGKKKDKKKYYNNLSYNEDVGMLYDYGVGDYSGDYYYDEAASQWYKYDEDTNTALWDAYYAVEDRLYLREYLQEETYTQITYKVCCASATQKEKVICEDVAGQSVDASRKLVMYNKVDTDMEKPDIKSFSYTSDMIDYLDNNLINYKENYYVIGSGSEQKLDLEEDVITVSSKGDSNVAFVTMKEDKYSLYHSQISEGKLSSPKEVTDDCANGEFLWLDNVLYYFTDLGNNDVADICKYENGKSTKIKKNVSLNMKVAKDSRLIELDDGTLKLYDMSGEETKVSGDVDSYSYLSKDQILYMSDEDLYLYTPKDSKLKIAKDVDGYVTCAEDFDEDVSTYYLSSY